MKRIFYGRLYDILEEMLFLSREYRTSSPRREECRMKFIGILEDIIDATINDR